ncbi:MAG TPA: Ig domain-containing protein [Clostridiales bacterium]|nr:Ig domain-containing protein [Clostridiales bacterium]
MKRLSKFFKVCALALTLAVVAPSIAPANTVAAAQAATKKAAATVKLNKSKLTLTVGDTAKLTVSGTKSKVTWATSKKTVATVDKTGKVTAVKAGAATITATVNKKKYTCKVTVKAQDPKIAKAPFKAQEVVFGDLKGVLPKDWENQVLVNAEGTYSSAAYPKSADLTATVSGVQLLVQYNGLPKMEYSEVKDYFTTYITEELINSQLAAQGLEITVTDFKTSDFESSLGTAFKTEYKIEVEGMVVSQAIYDVYIDNYLIQVSVSDMAGNTTPDAYTVGEYLLNTLEVVKK